MYVPRRRFTRMQVTGYPSAAEVPGRLAHGCYLSGLYLEGAAWDAARGCLTRQRPMARAPCNWETKIWIAALR